MRSSTSAYNHGVSCFFRLFFQDAGIRIKIIHLCSAVADDACRSFNMENPAEESLQSMGRESRFESEANVWSEHEERRARSSSYLQPWRFGVPIAGQDRDFGYVDDSLRERETEHSP